MNDEFTYAVIGLAMEVHRELGPGLDERLYHALLGRKLSATSLNHMSRPRRELIHGGLVADVFEPDIVFPDKLVVELKCLTGAFAGEHLLQLICYLKFWKIRVGLLFDFGKESLAYRRVEFVEPDITVPERASLLEGGPPGELMGPLPGEVCETVRRVLAEFGFGYRDTTYTGLLAAAFRACDVDCVLNPLVDVCSGDDVLGRDSCACLLVSEKLVVKVLALRRSITAADIAITRTYIRLLAAKAGLILNFDRSSLALRWVGVNPAKQ